jgi:cytochrome c
MIKKVLALMMAILFVASVGVAMAEDRGTAAEAKEMVNKAVAYVKEVGKDKALAEFNAPNNKFRNKDLYVFAGNSIDGTTLAHPIKGLMNKPMINLKDADGKQFIKEAIEMANKVGSGTVEYRWTHPQTKKVEKKASYFEKVDGIILYCGYYL